VKKGKQELYVKDDNELNAVLLNTALKAPHCNVNAEAHAAGVRARDVGSQVRGSARDHQALVTRYDDRLLEQLIYMPVVSPDDFDRSTGCVAGRTI